MKRIFILLLTAVILFSISGCTKDAINENTLKIAIHIPTEHTDCDNIKKEIIGIRYAHSLKNNITLNGIQYRIELTDNTDSPFIYCSCTETIITVNEHLFSLNYTDAFQGSIMANYAKSSGVRTVYILSQKGDTYSEVLSSSFKNTFESLGGTVVCKEFTENITDFTEYISEAKAKGIDAFFTPISPDIAEYFIRQSYENDVTYKIISGNNWNNAAILNASVDTDLDISIPAVFDENNDKVHDFVNNYKEWLRSDIKTLTDNGGSDNVSVFSALGYDAYNLIISAIENPNITQFDGITGNIKFDENGNAVREFACIEGVNTSNGSFKFVKIQTVK